VLAPEVGVGTDANLHKASSQPTRLRYCNYKLIPAGCYKR